uniref:CRAL-TRIO domain-containing protein n=1 Tax=Hemiselmis tepida TaxID=464990 RepID=A0A7S0VL64_9CRYP|mmetsp:Transcript_19081/g.48181  ORF Transcript_19081/g.48181 Transcript_19081/m.48181 type:complete len:221 (+) Transcript_19081:718-1380(+)
MPPPRRLVSTRAKGFSEVDSVFDDSYLKSVMNRTKNGKQRTFEYSLEKLEASLQWRREYGAAQVTYEDVAASLSPQHMVWKGFDASGRPVLYAKPSDMDLSTYSTDNYLKAHVYLLEQGIAMIPKGQTTFVLVADASGMGKKHTDLKLMRQLAGIATTAYPDRLGMLLVGPVNMLVRGIWAVVSRLVSPSVASKIRFVRSPRAAVCAMLRQGEEPPEWLS